MVYSKCKSLYGVSVTYGPQVGTTCMEAINCTISTKKTFSIQYNLTQKESELGA